MGLIANIHPKINIQKHSCKKYVNYLTECNERPNKHKHPIKLIQGRSNIASIDLYS